MEIYLPIAEMSVNLFLLLGLGGLVGFLSGLLGVGGGFLMTPLLLLMGVPPAIAVGTQPAQILASSFSGVLAHLRRGNVDLKMGWVLTAGGALGSALGVLLFGALHALGQIDVFVSLAYVVLLGSVGTMMLVEAGRAMLRRRAPGGGRRRRLHRHYWFHGWPLKMRFPRSRLYISVLMPLLLGLLVGALAALMGVGGAFIMAPAMVYLLGMPTSVMVGTSLFQICFVTAVTAFLQATGNHTVDIVLALLLTAGGVIGAQLGTRAGAKLRGEQLRLLLAVLVLMVCGKLAFDLATPPDDRYSLGATTFLEQ